jgi:hypothetical protein
LTGKYGYYARRRKPITEIAPQSKQSVAIDDEPLDMSRIPLNNRLALADKIAMAHPERPISGMLLELFPELNLLRKATSHD